MGTVTAVVDPDGFSPIDGSNAGLMVRAKITFSNSYATGGDTVNASSFGLGTITKMITGGGGVSGGTTNYDTAPVYNSSSQVTKLQAFVTGTSANSQFNEVANGTNLSTVVVDAVLFGT